MLSLGIFSLPLLLLQIFLPIRLIRLIKAHKREKAKNRADRITAVGIVGYGILTAAAWFPLMLPLISYGRERYFIIIRSRFIGGGFVLQSMALVLLFAFAAYRSGRELKWLRRITFWVYAVCEFLLTYSYHDMLWESVLATLGGIALPVWIGVLTGTVLCKIKKKRSETENE